MTTRDRRLARAERLREWADKRDGKAKAAFERSDAISSMIPFGQPILVGHHSERRHRKDIERIENGMRAGIDNSRTADGFRSRADNIEAAADQAIYDDDPDAIERLEAKIEKLEAKRTKIKQHNATARKEGRKDDVLPSYVLQNLGGLINTTKKRLERLRRIATQPVAARPSRPNKYAGICEGCGGDVAAGAGDLTKGPGGWEVRHKSGECEG